MRILEEVLDISFIHIVDINQLAPVIPDELDGFLKIY